MNEFPTPVADNHASSPPHTGVDRNLPKDQAERRVVSVGRQAPYRVTGIDVLEVYLFPDCFKVTIDLIAQETSDIPKADITRGIPLLGLLH